MPTTVNDLIRLLKEFPGDANWRAYEGEVSGIIITSKNGRDGGVIHNDGHVTQNGKTRKVRK